MKKKNTTKINHINIVQYNRVVLSSDIAVIANGLETNTEYIYN